MKEYKCFYCKEKDTESNLEVETTEKIKQTTDKFGLPVEKKSVTRKKYHQKCKDEFEKNKMYREKLFNYIANKYELLVVPPSFYTQTQKYIKDNNISLELAYRTYESIGDAIDWSLNNVKFDNVNKALIYGFAIFKNHVNEVYQEMKREERRKEQDEISKKALAKNMDHYNMSVPINKQQKTDEADISDFL